jgi:hypothetical protein
LRANSISRILALCLIGASACLLATPAMAQVPCFVAQPNLTFNQWYSYCAQAIAQTCASPAFQAFGDAACQQMVAQGMYGTYVQSQSMPACGQGTYGASICWAGWLRYCDGSMWVATSNRC